jgi:hypothetical protein
VDFVRNAWARSCGARYEQDTALAHHSPLKRLLTVNGVLWKNTKGPGVDNRIAEKTEL